jgi:hypothetical protein
MFTSLKKFAIAGGFFFLLACQPIHSATTVAQDVTIKVENGESKTITIKKDGVIVDDGQKKPFTGNKAAVDVAILLDTSNSMDGLITQAQAQLWSIVQEFAKAKKAGQTPQLRVAIFEYGNSGLPATEGYIRQVQTLTTDLDKVSEALFSLSTRGGDEYCGMVIDECLDRLDWNNEPNSYKSIFIAGNEPFTQGNVEYQQACKKAIQSGVVVNTIHCGDYQQGVSGKWQHAASLAEGEYLNINQDKKVVQIKCPQDKIIIELNKELNKTYLWYGKQAKRGYLMSNQAAQDGNAFGVGGGLSRAAAKATPAYNNRGRDLVDTFGEDTGGLLELSKDVLPEEMQKMTDKEQAAYLKKKTQKRAEIKRKINELSQQRAAFIAEERKKMTAEGKADKTLGDAMTESVRKQLKKSGFEIDR